MVRGHVIIIFVGKQLLYTNLVYISYTYTLHIYCVHILYCKRVCVHIVPRPKFFCSFVYTLRIAFNEKTWFLSSSDNLKSFLRHFPVVNRKLCIGNYEKCNAAKRRELLIIVNYRPVATGRMRTAIMFPLNGLKLPLFVATTIRRFDVLRFIIVQQLIPRNPSITCYLFTARRMSYYLSRLH
jgi:hypothetical protein